MARIFVPIASPGFDPTEVAVPATIWKAAGHEVVLATHDGRPAKPDRLMDKGAFFGVIRVLEDARARYETMKAQGCFEATVPWGSVDILDFDAFYVPGGHMVGMRALAWDPVLQEQVRRFWVQSARPFAAICHGVALPAEAGVLVDVKTTCFLAGQERALWLATFFAWGSYARVFPRLLAEEVRAGGAQLLPAPLHILGHGSLEDDSAAFVAEDGRYLSGRWPGDAYLIAKRLLAKL